MRWSSMVVVTVMVACSPIVEQPDGGEGGGSVGGGQVSVGGGNSSGGSVGGGEVGGGSVGGGSVGGGNAGGSVAGGTSGGVALDAGQDAGRADAGVDAGVLDGGTRVRVIAANLTSGNNQNYDPGHGQRILQALEGDVIAIQEFNFGNRTPTDLRAFVDATFGSNFFYVRGTGNIPNGVVSRFPILDAGEWDDSRTTDREFVWALIDLPSEDDLLVVSVHLLSNTSTNRNAQGAQLLQYIDNNAPGVPHVVIAGDFNTDTRGEAVITTFSAKTATASPWPVDAMGNGGTNITRARPYDWVLASPGLRALEVPVAVGAQRFPAGLVFDTRVFTPLPPPSLAGDSAATGMQHMAVVRDFVVY